MTYRSLLVHLDHDRRFEARLAYALRIARALGCHVVGAAPTGAVPLAPEVSIVTAASLSDYADAVWMMLDERAQAAQARFEEACRQAGLESHASIVEHADKAQSLVRLSHCSDIVVISQADPEAPDFPAASERVADIVLRSARPTIVLPFAGEFDTIASRVLVAWDDSREAARALADALPLLRLAGKVQLVTWERGAHVAEARWPERHAALQRWLQAHGVAAEPRLSRSGNALSEAMLSRAFDGGADLIVMGAYGHRRWAERVLGGTTHGMLASMTVPVLMSH
jgi:nucleotide-binding universal stress UspA family protein